VANGRTNLSGIVSRHLRRRFAKFMLRTHLLDHRSLFPELFRQRLNLFLLLCVPFFQILNSFVRFQELIEQHRVHRVVAHTVPGSAYQIFANAAEEISLGSVSRGLRAQQYR
jgi:hypothetical protein